MLTCRSYKEKQTPGVPPASGAVTDKYYIAQIHGLCQFKLLSQKTFACSCIFLRADDESLRDETATCRDVELIRSTGDTGGRRGAAVIVDIGNAPRRIKVPLRLPTADPMVIYYLVKFPASGHTLSRSEPIGEL